MRTNDMRVPQVEQVGRKIATLGALATIVAIILSRRKTNGSKLPLSAKLVGPQNAAI